MGTNQLMSFVSAILAKLASLPIVTIAGRGRRITQAIDFDTIYKIHVEYH